MRLCIIISLLISLQIGKRYHFIGVRANAVRAQFAHLSKNPNGMELFGTNTFDVKEIQLAELTTAERNSIAAKKDGENLVGYQCPKVDCGHYMEKIVPDDYKCSKCDMNYSNESKKSKEP